MEFLLEIGTEELPSRFLPGLERELTEKCADALAQAGLGYMDFEYAGTPRRNALYITGLAAETRRSEEIVSGPPLRIAYDKDGNPTKAAEGFAKTQGVPFDALFVQETKKGQYLAVRKQTGGEKALDVLKAAMPDIIQSLSFPKRMHWGDGDFTFARPLRWVVALLDADVVPFTVGGVESGRMTHGHRVHGPGPFALAKASDYFNLMKNSAAVMPKAADRRALIIRRGDELAKAAGGQVLWKDSLLDEVQGLCEHPVPLLGSFDSSFLEIPEEVLLTSMEVNQKSFGLRGPDGALLPHFLTVLNITPKNESLVRKGWERVLHARLEDARFFWKTDLKTDFALWLDRLDKVIFLAPVGSMGDKGRRVSALAGFMAEQLGHTYGVGKPDAERAGRLAKADLVSEMVGEFDSLQGIMGSIYAARKGENAVVAQALAEQYLPAGPDSPLPETPCGALVSMADKLDTLAGCFGLGMIPTGTADPYALRRCALGIARILIDRKIRLDVRALFAKAQELYGDKPWKLQPADALEKLTDFFLQRLKNYFVGQGMDTLLVEAVLPADNGVSETPEKVDVWSVTGRLEALREFSARPDFAQAVQTFKRAANIIRKQADSEKLDGRYDATLMHDAAEKKLAERLESVLPEFETLWRQDEYAKLFTLLHTLRPEVDAFFTDVMVICEDPTLRRNRLNLLYKLVTCLRRLADFDALQV